MAVWPRVLVVEDELPVAEIIASVLDEEYSVSTAGTVADAIRQLRETDFAAVLLDCLLPNGHAAEIIAAAETRNIPLIVMSGDPGQAENNWVSGFSFLPKPFSIEELQNALRAVLTPKTR
jgi:DNA-binding response OmpR family regulator